MNEKDYLKYKRITKLKYIITSFIVILIISFFGYIIYHKNNNKAFKIFGSYVSVVISESMEDTIMTNDFIIYKESETYQIEDVIVFSVNGELIVHRIIAETVNGFITKGDNNHSDDLIRFGYIQKHQIVGKVSKNIHLLGLGKLLNKQ